MDQHLCEGAAHSMGDGCHHAVPSKRTASWIWKTIPNRMLAHRRQLDARLGVRRIISDNGRRINNGERLSTIRLHTTIEDLTGVVRSERKISPLYRAYIEKQTPMKDDRLGQRDSCRPPAPVYSLLQYSPWRCLRNVMHLCTALFRWSWSMIPPWKLNDQSSYTLVEAHLSRCMWAEFDGGDTSTHETVMIVDVVVQQSGILPISVNFECSTIESGLINFLFVLTSE